MRLLLVLACFMSLYMNAVCLGQTAFSATEKRLTRLYWQQKYKKLHKKAARYTTQSKWQDHPLIFYYATASLFYEALEEKKTHALKDSLTTKETVIEMDKVINLWVKFRKSDPEQRFLAYAHFLQKAINQEIYAEIAYLLSKPKGLQEEAKKIKIWSTYYLRLHSPAEQEKKEALPAAAVAALFLQAACEIVLNDQLSLKNTLLKAYTGLKSLQTLDNLLALDKIFFELSLEVYMLEQSKLGAQREVKKLQQTLQDLKKNTTKLDNSNSNL